MKVRTLYLLLCVSSLGTAFLFLVIGLYGIAVGINDAGLAGSVCFTAFIVPGIFFLYYWRRSTAIDRTLVSLVDILKGYPEITLKDLAAKIETTPQQAEILVAACIGRGLIRGHIEKQGNKFVLDDGRNVQDAGNR